MSAGKIDRSWARFGHTECAVCKKKDRPHHAKGVCERCHSNVNAMRHYDATVDRVTKWQKKHPAKFKEYQRKSKQRTRYGFAEGDAVIVPVLGMATCIGRPRYVKGERICDLLLGRTKEVLEKTPTAGIKRVD